MLPDLHWSVIPLGILNIQVWGVFVALGIIAGLWLAKWYAEQRKLDGQLILDAGFWIIASALIGSRVWFVATEWQLFSGRWIDTLKIWEGGMSLSGGLVGAVLAAVIYFRYRNVSFLTYADVMVFALPLGMAIGRLGCFFIFDHPGSVTNFWLGEVYYADGLVRHNHGLYLVLDGLVLFGLFAYLRLKVKQIKAPFFITLYLLWYGLVRLVLDFDRLADSRYYSLTAAQWLGIVMIVAGLSLFGTRQIIRKKFL